MSFSFVKYEGAGNDFILIDDRRLRFPIRDALRIRRLCDRRLGIGADGIILLQNDPEADARMRILNSDGSEAEGCGNGLRCLMAFLGDLGLPRIERKISVGGRILHAGYSSSGIVVDMGEMRDFRPNLTISRGEESLRVHYIDSGVPHAVVFVDDIEGISLVQLGPFLRFHPCFAPKGANVNIACRLPDGRVRVRTYERGVEGETLACGTGGTAVGAIGARLFGWENPIRISFAGGDLEINLSSDKRRASMTGPAVKVFEGTLPAQEPVSCCIG